MDVNAIERHMGKPKIYEFKDENGVVDKFEFRPLGFEYLADFMAMMKNISKNKPGDSGLENFNDETSERIRKLIMGMLKKSMPEVSEDKLSVFAMSNFSRLFEILMELNDFGASKDVELRKRIEHIKELRAGEAKGPGGQ